MAARSARTPSEEDAEEDVRSTSEEDRLLTMRYVERQWNPCDHESDGQSYQRGDQESAQFLTHCQGDVHTRLGQRPGSQTVTSFFPE